MNYYDIHTHAPATNPEDYVVISADIHKPIISSGLHYSLGIHPWYINYNLAETTRLLFEKVREYSLHPTVVALGETGLDKITAKTTNDFQFQQTLFTLHAKLSEEIKKPLIVHCVRGWDELLRIRQSVNPFMPWIIHGFKGKSPLAKQLLNAGFYLSFGQHYHKESLLAAWTNHRLLIETDKNHINIRDVYQQLSNDLNITVNELSVEIDFFFHQFFPLR